MALLQSLLEQFPSNISFSIICIIISIFLIVPKLTRKSKLNLPPSPPKLPFIGNLHQLGTHPHRSVHALSKKYGPLMFLQLGQTPTLVVSSADVAKEIFRSHDVVFSGRPHITTAKFFLYDAKDIVFAPYGEEWRQKRKVCVHELLSSNRVKSFQSIREQEIAELVGTIREAASKGSCVNLSEMVIAITNDIMSKCVFGQKYDSPDGSSSSFGELGRKITSRFVAFSVRDFFPSLGWVDVLTGLNRELKSTFSALDAFFDEIIAGHQKNKRIKINNYDQSASNDFVEILLHLQESNTLDFDLTKDGIKAILADMILGGSDTTSTTLEWAFAELIKNPNIMKKAQEEVRRVVGNKSKVDENDDVNQMNYLKCVIKETLRLHPSLPILIPRETTASVKVKGYDIPSKTRVFLNAWAIHRDPKVWDNPEDFIPERFESRPVDIKEQDFQLIPFGSGRRGCPGIPFGLASAECVLANLLYWFDWKLPGVGAVKQDIDMSEMSGITVNKKIPLHLEPVPYSLI